MKLFLRQRTLESKNRSPHVLDLKQEKGGLDRLFFDLPNRDCSPQLLYLRQRERWFLPPSYRTGLVFFATVMLVSMVGISALDATTLAESRRFSLGAQIAQGFAHFAEELESYADQELDPDDRLASTETKARQQSFSALHSDSFVMSQEPVPRGVLLRQPARHNHMELLEIGLELSKGYQAFQNLLETWETENDLPLTEKLQWMHRSARQAATLWQKALKRARRLSPTALPREQQNQFDQALALVDELTDFLNAFTTGFDLLLSTLGAEEPQRILVLIQDPHAKRATGGALSVGIELLVDEGEILSWDPFHVAEYDELLRVELQPPQELADITDRWSLATANAFLDTPQSAEQVHWFWQREARSSVDTVVLINSSAFERLFDESGILDLLEPERASELNDIALKWSARQYNDQVDELKSLASVVMNEVLAVFQQPERLLKAWPVLQQLSREKQILVTSLDPKHQQLLASFGMSGALPDPEEHGDFLMVAGINSENTANDSWIDESHTLHTSIKADGTIKHWLKLQRRHSWDGAFITPLLHKIGFPLKNNVFPRLASAENRRFTQVVVPKGSQLIGASGIALTDIRTRNTDVHTIWSFEDSLHPRETSEVELFYELPWTFDTESLDNYRLQLVKQPGSSTVAFEHQIKLPAELTIFQQLPEEPITELEQDEIIAVVAGRNPSF